MEKERKGERKRKKVCMYVDVWLIAIERERDIN